MSAPLAFDYFSDLLCIWAYVGQVRLDEVEQRFGDRVRVDQRFVSVYGDVEGRIRAQYGENHGARAAYADRVREVAAGFAHARVSPRVFREVVPRTSNMGHLALCGLRIAAQRGQLDGSEHSLLGRAVRSLRLAFFEDARDIGQLPVVLDVLGELGIVRGPIQRAIDDGAAMAALSADFKQVEAQKIVGSPTYVLDGGREKLFGNVGYRIIEANLHELLERESPKGASWC
jgi:predicted DsbA family dithiol-disulfide isomerase